MLQKTGILIVGHGTRDQAGVAEFVAAAKLAADLMPSDLVEHCFLELATPSITDAVDRLARSGAEKIVVAPLLLFAAGHVKEDIPRLVAEATSNYAIPFLQAEPLDRHEKIVAASAQRFQQTTGSLSPEELDHTFLILVGRGSSDANTVPNMRRFADQRVAATPVGRCEIGFMAAAEPTIRDVLVSAEHSSFKRIVVQPHLLFRGQVLETLHEFVGHARADSREKETEWLMTEHLGATPAIAEALVDRCRQVLKEAGF